MSDFLGRMHALPRGAIESILLIVCILWALIVGIFSSWVMLYAITGVGRSLAVAGLIVGVIPGALFLEVGQPRHSPWLRKALLALAFSVVVILACVLIQSPSGKSRLGASVANHWTQGDKFQRYTLANIVPEIEQVNMGFRIMPYVDPFLTREQAQRVSAYTLAMYKEMDEDHDFWQLGSVMNWAYADFLGYPFETGHYYLYIPKNRAAGALPVIVFLHGNFGNFKTYIWAWAKLAEQGGYAIVAPSFGFGNWHKPEGTQAILEALEDAKRWVEIDENRLYLAGLSNGGLGISRLAYIAPDQFRGLIFISPVMVPEIVDRHDFQETWHRRPVLIITGESDERIPLSYVRERALQMEGAGISVTYITYPGEDHFLFFSQLDSVLSDISRWLKETGEQAIP